MTHSLDVLKELSRSLSSYGIEDVYKESEIILTSCTGIDRVILYRDNPELSAFQVAEVKQIIERRSNREPIQYIIGYVDFYGLKIKVGPGVLIPRPETELLVEEVIGIVRSKKSGVRSQNSTGGKKFTGYRHLNADSRLNILDLCTGSGCIALAIAKHLPESSVYGTDISEKAIGYARENTEINNIENVTFLKGDLYHYVKGMKFDIIVSNPPYIKRSELRNLQPEIKEWEPMEALDGGEDGLELYRGILSGSREHLKSGGLIILEIGQGEAGDVVGIAEDSGLKYVAAINDYSGVERILCLAPR